jgi:anti-sigma factor RsiW
MADCRELEPLFAAYVDGEAAACDCAALDAHFRSCPPCRSRIEAERIVKEAVATHRTTLRACASEDLRRRCEAGCRTHAPAVGASAGPKANVFARRTWVPLSMVATVVLTVAGVFIYSLKDGTEALAAQLAVDHVKCFEFASPPVIIPDAKLLSREWAEARGWTVKVPASEPVEQLELLGIRRCISTEGTTAHLMYKWRGQPLSVYVLNSEDPRVSSTPRLVERFGQEELIWSKKGRTYAVVAQGRPSEIQHVALYVQRAAE